MSYTTCVWGVRYNNYFRTNLVGAGWATGAPQKSCGPRTLQHYFGLNNYY